MTHPPSNLTKGLKKLASAATVNEAVDAMLNCTTVEDLELFCLQCKWTVRELRMELHTRDQAIAVCWSQLLRGETPLEVDWKWVKSI